MDGKKEQSGYRYSVVEAALCDVFDIKPEGMQPFQARLRHLRGLGVPDLPRSGSGKHIEYSFNQVLEVAFALTLQRYSVAPRIAAGLGPDIAKTVGRMGTGSHHEDVYIILEPSKSGSLSYEFVPGLSLLKFKIDARCEDNDVLMILNASNLVRKIERALTSRERTK